jgi:hypothetical protein
MTTWHIKAAEPRVLDYNEASKSAGQVIGLGSGDAYRSCDHIPAIVGLELETEPPAWRGLPLVIRQKPATCTRSPRRWLNQGLRLAAGCRE